MKIETLKYQDVGVGDELPPLEVPITATLIVAGALASRDFQDVHHDREIATISGAKDIFMNILTTSGLVGRFITDWAGPEAIIKKFSIRLGVPNFPGDVMQLTGRVQRVENDDVEIEIRGANRLGDHVTGSVQIALPGR